MYATDFAQVGVNIQKQLEKRGLTQQELADELKISKQVMNKIIKGNKAINVTEIAKIASVLSVSTDELLSAPLQSDPQDTLSFMGRIKDEQMNEKVNMIRSAIDEIHMLEDLLHE